MTVFVTVDNDGDEAVALFHGAPMIAFHDRQRVEQLREIQHAVAINESMSVREVVFVRANGKRYHAAFDSPDDMPWHRDVDKQMLDLFNDACDDPRCHRRHVYLNYATTRSQDAARGRKMKRRQ